MAVRSLPVARAVLAAAFLLLSAPAASALGLAEAPGSGADEAIQALDVDKSGRVEKADVEAFALSQGLTADEVRSEFKDLDLNGDGELSADEIHNTLGDAESTDASSASASAPSAAAGASSAATAAPAARALPAAAAATVDVALSAPEAAEGTPAVARASLAEDSAATQLEALASEAGAHASKALAEVFAQQAAKALEARGEDARKAAQLEASAKSLRGQTAEIRRTAALLTARAAREAAESVLHSTADQVRGLEAEAARDDREAEVRRREARAAMRRAVEAQAEMASDVQRLESQEAP